MCCSGAGSFAAVRMRLQALRAAIKKTVSSSTAAAAVTREAAREAAANPHGGGKYSFRQRKAAGALAEPSPGTFFTVLLFIVCYLSLLASTSSLISKLNKA